MAALIYDKGKPQFCEPLSLALTKDHLRVVQSDTSQDDIINMLIAGAREYSESFCRRSWINKGFIQMLDSFPTYTDTLMSQQAYPPAYYSLPRYSTSLWNYSQMMKLFVSPLAHFDHIMYLSATDASVSSMGVPTALQVTPMPWFPLEDYSIGDTITDNNNLIQRCVFGGKSGLNPPDFSETTGQFTDDGLDSPPLQWPCTGWQSPPSNLIVDSASEPPRIFPVAGGFWPACRYVPNAVRMYFKAGYNVDPVIASELAAWGRPCKARPRL